jgi:release factor glutamine methyltransferase
LSQINLINSHWLNAICKNSLDIIIANPPYIGASDACFTSKSISFEPEIALYANNEGMSAIEALTLAGSDCLKPGGFLLIEHGFAQKKQVISCFLENNFINVITRTDLAGHDRVTYGQKF